jgi:hypothetical protein
MHGWHPPWRIRDEAAGLVARDLEYLWAHIFDEFGGYVDSRAMETVLVTRVNGQPWDPEV